MKSRRHRAIDKTNKDITMCPLFVNKKIKKDSKKYFNRSDKLFYLEMSKLFKNKSFKEKMSQY